MDILRENPLMSRFGSARDDPDFDGYLDEIRKYREEVDRPPSMARTLVNAPVPLRHRPLDAVPAGTYDSAPRLALQPAGGWGSVS